MRVHERQVDDLPAQRRELEELAVLVAQRISGAARTGETTSGPASFPGFSAGSGVLSEETIAAGVVVPLPASSLAEPPPQPASTSASRTSAELPLRRPRVTASG